MLAGDDGVPLKTVYVFRIGHLGDALLILPAVKELRRRYPAAALHLITNEPDDPSYLSPWDVLQHSGHFERALLYRPNQMQSWLRLSRQIRERPGEKILYYLPPYRSVRQRFRDRLFFQYGCRIDTLIGLPEATQPELRDDSGGLSTLEPEWRRFLRTVAGIDNVDCGFGGDDGGDDGRVPNALELPLLEPPPSARQKAKDLLGSLGEESFMVALGVGSNMSSKRWFKERFTEIARRILASRPDACIVVSGGPQDRLLGETIVEGLEPGRVLVAAGLTSFIENAAVLERCSLYVGNDTGTMHLAASMGVRCVALFSARDNPGKWDPVGSGHVILRHEVSCAGCLLDDCVAEKMRCLDGLTVNSVWQRVQPLLSS